MHRPGGTGIPLKDHIMNTAKQNFKSAYSIVRKNAAYIIDRAADYYGQTDDEAADYWAATCVGKTITAGMDKPAIAAIYRASSAATFVLLSVSSTYVKLTAKEQLARNRENEEFGFD